jgi:hypothetical protein
MLRKRTVPRPLGAAQRLGHRWRRADGLDHVGKSADEHGVVASADGLRARDARELLDVAARGVEAHDVLGAEPLGGARLVLVLGEHRHLRGGEQGAQTRHGSEADDRRAGH